MHGSLGKLEVIHPVYLRVEDRGGYFNYKWYSLNEEMFSGTAIMKLEGRVMLLKMAVTVNHLTYDVVK